MAEALGGGGGNDEAYGEDLVEESRGETSKGLHFSHCSFLFTKRSLFRKLKMTEDSCFPNKDTLVVNRPKKFPLFVKMVALAAVMICCVCICSVFLKQLEMPTELHIERVDLVKETIPHVVRINLTEINLSHVVRANLSEKNLTYVVRVNLTEVTLPHVLSVNISEKILPPAVSSNSTERIFHPAMKVNLTRKPPLDAEVLLSQNLHVHYPRTKSRGREKRACMPVSPYAIVSVQRSGSKWFEALLNSHENIWSHGEAFYNIDRKCNMTVITRVLNKVYSLNQNASTFRRKRHSCLAAVGFKWMLNQGIIDNHEGIVNYFNHRGVSAILLFRRNHLRRLVSLKANNHDDRAMALNGTHKAHVNTKEEADILASYKPKLNVKVLIHQLEHMERLLTDTLQNFKSTRHMVVYYEDLVQNQNQTMMDVLEFLGVPQKILVSGHVKIHTRPLAQQIANWKAVAKVIKRTKFKRFITANDYEA